MKPQANLAKAIIQVMKAVDSIEKGATVGTGGSSYKGVKDIDVKQAYKKAMIDAGLCILPIGIDPTTTITSWETNDQYGKKRRTSVFTEVETTYLLIHSESGESQEIKGYGHGSDSQDKSAGKATTYALKNAILYTFLTPTGNIDDTDGTHSEDIAQPKTQKQAQTKKKLPTLKKGSDQWKKILEFHKKGVLKSVDQVAIKFTISKAVAKEIQAMIDEKAPATTDDPKIEEKKDTKSETPQEVAPQEVATKIEDKKPLPKLSKANFVKAKTFEKLDITRVLAEFQMTADQRKELEALEKASKA